MQRRSNTGDCSAGSSDDRSRVADAATQQAPPRSVGRPPSNTGRATYEYHPEYHPRVGHKPFLPKDRHTAVNYLRLLLYDSVFDHHSYKSGANTTKACARGNTINDVHHFLLECPTHSLARQDLITSVTDIWNNSDKTGKIVISAPLLLAPTSHSRLTAAECNAILLATFQFIRLSGLNL